MFGLEICLSPTSLSFSPDGKMIASGSFDSTVKLWRLRDGKLMATLRGHSDKVNSVSFSHDGKTIASASDDQTIKLWSIDGQELRTLSGHQAAVLAVSFGYDIDKLASASGDDTVLLWNLKLEELDNPELDYLLKRGCGIVDDYLNHNTTISRQEHQLCQGISLVGRYGNQSVAKFEEK
ncbi:WD40 repeat domain-containing protein [Lyngbya aestuarii]|uniref:WD40 repeat domain-containing protein n=1 Tax=Lyngbya aestuarii TaxID=118322 RepID=UPI00403E2C1D